MRPEIASVCALIFDIGGTVFDWLSAVTDALAVLTPAHRPPDLDPAEFAIALGPAFSTSTGVSIGGSVAG